MSCQEIRMEKLTEKCCKNSFEFTMRRESKSVNNFLKELKTESGCNFYRSELAVTDSSGAVCGNLEPITVTLFDEPSVQVKLITWHRGSESSHLLRVPLTDTDILQHLETTYLSENAGILFFITSLAGQQIGNIGLNRVTTRSAELCSVARGEFGVHPHIVENAARTLVGLGFGVMNLSFMYLTVLSTNLRAVNLYQRIGFKISSEQALFQEENMGYIRHTFVKAEMSNVPYRCLVMSLKKRDLN